MKLVFNIGNTNITAGIFSGDNLGFKIRLRTNINYTEDQYFSVLYTLLQREGVDISDIDTAVIGSVVPAITRVITHMTKKYLKIEPFMIGPKTRLNFRNRYKNPGDVGDDRLANAAAAISIYGRRDMVVIDIGTGTTFDVISGKKGYLGGIIMPGLNLMLQSLFTKTAKLPQVNLKFPASVFHRRGHTERFVERPCRFDKLPAGRHKKRNKCKKNKGYTYGRGFRPYSR